MAPPRAILPKVGRREVFAQRVEGDTIEPRVSEPIANGRQPAAVAAAGPADEPLEPRAGFHGLLVRPRNHSSPIARAPRESFATKTAPASSSFRITEASSESTWSSKGFAPHVVAAPAAESKSFAP